MIKSFRNQATEDIFNGINSKLARKICPVQLLKVAIRKLDLLDSVVSLDELRIPPSKRLEALSGDREGRYSIRINGQYRICFVWITDEPAEIEIVDYH